MRLLQRKFIVLFNSKKKMRESLTQTTVTKETGQNSPSQTVDFTDPFSYFQAEKSLAGKCEREKTKINIFKVKYNQQNFYIYMGLSFILLFQHYALQFSTSFCLIRFFLLPKLSNFSNYFSEPV